MIKMGRKVEGRRYFGALLRNAIGEARRVGISNNDIYAVLQMYIDARHG